MKKCSSLVWRFFDRIENETNRCIAVLCKLCETQYKFFGNTTNLRSHLLTKHPLQWELALNGTLDDSNLKTEDEETNQSTASPKRRKYSRPYNKKKNVDVLETSDVERDNEDSEATYHLVRQLHDGTIEQASDEEWLEEETYTPTYEPKRRKMAFRKIKREVVTPPITPAYIRVIKNETKPQSPIVIDNNKDEYSVFGEYVANKLRKFKLPRTQGNLQQLITTILWQAEYGAYDNAEAVKRILMYSVQPQEPEHFQQEYESPVQAEIIEHHEEQIN